MSYEFDEPFVLDTTKFQATFDTVPTPLATAVSTTVDWYRDRNDPTHGSHESLVS
jgi:hypothetical protein